MSNCRRPAPFPSLTSAASAVGLGALMLLLGALVFEHGLGLAPCPLCLDQRGPLAAAAMLALTAAATAPLAPGAARIPLTGAGSILLIGAGIALYHSGVELHWWPGPQSCTAAGLPGAITDLRAALSGARIIRCDAIPWSLFGLSLANYNAIVSTALAALAGLATRRSVP